MKIKSYKKDKNSQYEITFNNGAKLKLHEDLILKYELLLKKEIKDNEIESFIKENEKYELYTKVLKFLSIKMRTTKEIENKFKEYSKDSIKYVIDMLTKEGYLNEISYIKAYVNDQINLKLVGPNKIRNDLIKLGLKEEDINDYLDTIEDEIWSNKAAKLIEKQIQSNHTKSNSMLAIKITNDLINKGFNKELIVDLISSQQFQVEDEILEKDINKLYRKYNNKVDNDELNYLIKNKLIQKGYSKEKIEHFLSNSKND